MFFSFRSAHMERENLKRNLETQSSKPTQKIEATSNDTVEESNI